MAPPQMKSRLEMIRKVPGKHLGLILRHSSCQTPKRRLETAWGVVFSLPGKWFPGYYGGRLFRRMSKDEETGQRKHL
ncbi:hypothetical protein CEXT_100691 [Caerostris extrusa]|uniref:Uncharacterized protein n=1 Tax=Caerostris extrusa TaxID=172846 RepID=A0AAV4W743_CAEEX|nr:hypothetical protein CEXT_100691 [Caerostris extrusa]